MKSEFTAGHFPRLKLPPFTTQEKRESENELWLGLTQRSATETTQQRAIPSNFGIRVKTAGVAG